MDEAAGAVLPRGLTERLGRTYLGMLLGPALGLAAGVTVGAAIASSATSWAALPVIFLVASLLVLGGWGVGLWHTDHLGLGGFTVGCAALAPLLVLGVAAFLESWLVVVVLAAVLPLVVALVAHRRRVAGALAGVLVLVAVGSGIAGWGPLAGGRDEDRLVEDLQARDLEVFSPSPRSGLVASDVRLGDERVSYAVVDGELTHEVRIERRPPVAGSPALGDREQRAAQGVAERYEGASLITVVSRDAAGAKDLAAARSFAQGLHLDSPRTFAREADL